MKQINNTKTQSDRRSGAGRQANKERHVHSLTDLAASLASVLIECYVFFFGVKKPFYFLNAHLYMQIIPQLQRKMYFTCSKAMHICTIRSVSSAVLQASKQICGSREQWAGDSNKSPQLRQSGHSSCRNHPAFSPKLARFCFVQDNRDLNLF